MDLNCGSQFLVIIHEETALYKAVHNDSSILLYNLLR